MTLRTNPPLHVVGFSASHRGDAERGPQVRLRAEEARIRLISDRELVWVYGPRRHDLAEVVLDEEVPKGGAVLRDIAGVAVSEIIRLQKTDVDRRDKGKHA